MMLRYGYGMAETKPITLIGHLASQQLLTGKFYNVITAFEWQPLLQIFYLVFLKSTSKYFKVADQK
jgi:hypothetical protein